MSVILKFSSGNFSPQAIRLVIENFDVAEENFFGDGRRNKIKIFKSNEQLINVKSFQIPIVINKIVYRYFRKSKAKRSFENAQILIKKNIGTPEPVAYYEQHNLLGLGKSYYASEHLITDLTFRELINIPDYPDHENILRQFTYFCFTMHEQGIEFLDHSPGNTLIKKAIDGLYNFYLVDLNRMRFHQFMNLDMRLTNLQRLTPKKEMIEVMSDEYAKWYKVSKEIIFEKLWQKTHTFARLFLKRKRLKKKLKFWK